MLIHLSGDGTISATIRKDGACLVNRKIEYDSQGRIMRHNNKSLLSFSWEEVVILVLIIEVFVIQWLSYMKYYAIIIDIVLLLYLSIHPGRLEKKIAPFLFCAICFLYCAFQFVRDGVRAEVLFDNVHKLFPSVLILVTLSCFDDRVKKVNKALQKMFPIFNGYMLLNIPVLILQLHDHFELSGRHSVESTNPFKPDLICGLFGYNGTPMLGAFSAFFFVYNIWYYKYALKKSKKLFAVYYIFMFLFYLYISIQNENNGYFIVLALFMAIYFLCSQKRYKRFLSTIKKHVRLIAIFFLLLALLFIAYSRFNPVNDLVNKYIRVFNTGTTSYYSGGSTDRFSMVLYFFTSKINRLFGAGLGTMKWHEKMGFGFIHFGQSDLGPFLLLGGSILVALLTGILASAVKRVNRSRFITICEMLTYVILLVYTQLFTCPSIMISFILFITVCGLEQRMTDKKKPILQTLGDRL